MSNTSFKLFADKMGGTTPRFAQFPEVLDAWEKAGAVWGGKWSRADGMHWQFARVSQETK